MSRISCKICRRLGEVVCGREKCAYKKRPFAPGRLDSERKHRSGMSEFGEQLRAKQKMRFTYGLSENQFGKYVERAMNAHAKEVTPELSLYRDLESRLDNVVFRMSVVASRALARQVVTHGHIVVNGKRLNVPSYKVKKGDVVAIREQSRASKLFINTAEKLTLPSLAIWLKSDPKTFASTVTGEAREVEPIFDYQKVLEYYSR